MRCTCRTLSVIIALNVASIARTDEPAAVTAWLALQWKEGTPSPFARVESPAAVVNGKIYLFGGFTDDLQASARLDIYDPASDSWTRLKDMPTGVTHLNPAQDGSTAWQPEAQLPDPRGHVSAAVLDGNIYALGGDHGHDIMQIDVDSCHRFDPATNQWSAVASLPDGRSHFESSTIIYRDRILVVGGRCNSSKPPRNVVGDLLEYDLWARLRDGVLL